jgi:hypothetical protein
MARLYRCSRGLLWAMAAWALFGWGTRISNAVKDHDASAWSKTGAVALSLSFVVLAVATVVVLVRTRHDRLLTIGETRLVQVFSAWTTVVWLVFGTIILVHHHPVAFKAVHVTLGLISIGLSVATWRSIGEASVALPTGSLTTDRTR